MYYKVNCASAITRQHISFHIFHYRQKSGFAWFGHDKTETVNGYEAKVFTVSGVEMVTRTRTEHMSQEDMIRLEGKTIIFLLLKLKGIIWGTKPLFLSSYEIVYLKR